MTSLVSLISFDNDESRLLDVVVGGAAAVPCQPPGSMLVTG